MQFESGHLEVTCPLAYPPLSRTPHGGTGKTELPARAPSARRATRRTLQRPSTMRVSVRLQHFFWLTPGRAIDFGEIHMILTRVWAKQCKISGMKLAMGLLPD